MGPSFLKSRGLAQLVALWAANLWFPGSGFDSQPILAGCLISCQKCTWPHYLPVLLGAKIQDVKPFNQPSDTALVYLNLILHEARYCAVRAAVMLA